ncbi:MAG: HPr family phosphocarrier protein [Otoolea sp.]|nr:HPr family phosphocarrier protein [Clostridiaceae bacterium]MDD6074514.1 HPr family phosphocarrier protein [Clostridium sp.]MDY5482922.1 HPr family phosphocarrier protein [Clostridium sp.]
MKQKKIKLESVDDARAFVNAAMKCDFDVNVFYNRVVIDAKSILGVMSLDLTKVLTVEYNGTNELFEAYLTEKEAKVAAA